MTTTPRTAERVMRPMWAQDIPKWERYLMSLAFNMEAAAQPGGDPIPNYGFACQRCPFWSDHCQVEIMFGGK